MLDASPVPRLAIERVRPLQVAVDDVDRECTDANLDFRVVHWKEETAGKPRNDDQESEQSDHGCLVSTVAL